MEQKTIHFTECDDLQITSHLKEENLPQILQDLLSVAHTTEQKDMLMFDLLPDTQPTEVGIVSGSLQQKQFYDSLPQSFSRTDADSLANTLGMSLKSTDRWLTEWTKCSKLQRVAHGQYEKVS